MQPRVPSGREVSQVLRTVNAPAVILALIVIMATIATGIVLVISLEAAIKIVLLQYILGFFALLFVTTALLTYLRPRGLVLTESGHLREREMELNSRVIEARLTRLGSEEIAHLLEIDPNARLGFPPSEG